MIVDCISDLHGFYPEMEGEDLLIVAGNHDTQMQEEDYKKLCKKVLKLKKVYSII
jgi:metallophosphoesterase superfamily enzyme